MSVIICKVELDMECQPMFEHIWATEVVRPCLMNSSVIFGLRVETRTIAMSPSRRTLVRPALNARYARVRIRRPSYSAGRHFHGDCAFTDALPTHVRRMASADDATNAERTELLRPFRIVRFGDGRCLPAGSSNSLASRRRSTIW